MPAAPSTTSAYGAARPTVMVDGRILKDDFRLKADLGQPRKLVEESRDYLVSKFGVPEPGWLPTAVTA